jgi:GTP cyclohydrolase IA
MVLAADSAVVPSDLSDLVRQALVQLGEDPDREGLLRTPERVARSLRELTSGYEVDVDRLINDALFTVCYSEMVVVKDIRFYSLCEHHLLPFFGVCHVAYIPNKKVVGLSKIPKLVKAFSRRLQVQERLTSQIANILQAKVDPLGVAVVMEARHLCMEMRGAESTDSPTVTSAMLGVFRSDARTREEFLTFIRKR